MDLPEADSKLGVLIHAVAVIAGDTPHLGFGEPEGTHYQMEALRPRLHTTREQHKFVLMIEALVTLCTAKAGDNVALTVALSDRITVYVCPNGGRPFQEVEQHLKTVWEVLHQLHDAFGPSATYPTSNETQLGIVAKLYDLIYLFVADKTLRRAKRVDLFKKLSHKVIYNGSLTEFEEKVTQTLVIVAGSADAAFETSVEGDE